MKLPLSCKEMTCFIYAEKDVVYPALLVALYQAAERTENPARTLIKVARGGTFLNRRHSPGSTFWHGIAQAPGQRRIYAAAPCAPQDMP